MLRQGRKERRQWHVRQSWDASSQPDMLGEAGEAELLFHLALQAAWTAGSDAGCRSVAGIPFTGSLGATEAALAAAGRDLVAHPDDEVLRRAVSVLGESKRRLTESA